MSETDLPKKKTIILPFQQPLFARLCAIARGCLNVDRTTLGIKLRACFLLIGPSGGGKTFLAQALAEEMQVPYLSISVSDWVLLGTANRGGSATWPAILNFVERSKQKRGAIIYIDELDKCSHDSNWNAFLRSEIFSLCDCRVPMNINDLDGDIVSETRIEQVRHFLENKTMILAGAAFQNLWDNRTRSTMGFLQPDCTVDLPELPDLTKTLPLELINRFSSQIFILPELTEVDYRLMIETVAEQIPEIWRNRFLELGHARISEALRHKKGARYPEEILLAAIVAERDSLANFVPSPVSSEHVTKFNRNNQELNVF